MRADFYGKCARFAELSASISDHQLLVGPMSDDELRVAIELPAQRVGCEFQPGLVDLLVREVKDQVGGLPLLQHALLKLWEAREGRQLGFRAYERIGGRADEEASGGPTTAPPGNNKGKRFGLVGVLEQWADQVYGSFAPSSAEQDLCRRIFLRLINPGEGTEDTKRRARLEELGYPHDVPERVASVVERLIASRLVTAEAAAVSRAPTDESTTPQDDYIEVAHEALVRNWSKLRGWVEADRAGLRTHRRLTEDAVQWANNGRDSGFLYTGARRLIAEEWASLHRYDMNALETEFLTASHDAEQARKDAGLQAERERAELAEKRRQEQAEAAARLRRRARWLAVSGAGAFGMAMVALVLLFSTNEARKSAVSATKKAVAAQKAAISARDTANTEKARADDEAKRATRIGAISRAREFLALSQARASENLECSLALALKAYELAHRPRLRH